MTSSPDLGPPQAQATLRASGAVAFDLMGRQQFLGVFDGAAGVALAVERQHDAVISQRAR